MVWSSALFGARDSFRRQYAVAAATFAVLVLAIIFLFGHMISRSLSKQYLEDVLITGREEAREIAEEIGGGDQAETFFDAHEKRREVLVRTIGGLPQRQVWESVEVVDSDGKVVYTSRFQSAEEIPDELAEHLELSGTMSDQEVTETANTYRISVPLGEVGEVVLSVSKGRIAERVVRLRRQLLGQTITVAVVTLFTLIMAFSFVWALIQRTRRLETQRHEAQELAALGVLAANLAHEIRNPLNSINLNLELLEEDLVSGDPQVTTSVVKTREEVGRLARLVSDFLTYARPSTPSKDEIRVKELLTDVRDFLREEARSMGVHLRIAADPIEARVHGDAAQIRQVLLNLVLNGVQAVGGLEAERRVVELDAAAVDNGGAPHVGLCVRDRGDGIADEELPKVKNAFYTSRRGGTGLGLAIAERIVEVHGGRIELKNLEPRGFEARVVLPILTNDGNMIQ